MKIEDLLRRFFAGDRRACGQIISLVENEAESANEFLHRLFPYTGKAYRVGITGPPGAGKSSLAEKLVQSWRKQCLSVGVVAVDPTSPFTGGAILGDRVRMSSLFLDPGVFIRSMGSRGSLGGLALKTSEVCDVLDAFGKEIILIESIGVGQVELDIAETAHTTIVVLVPESGDSIQALKAGLMEIGDVFAVNKSDRDGADRLTMEIEAVMEMHGRNSSWRPPVVKTIATKNYGVNELLSRISEHQRYLDSSGLLARRKAESVRNQIVSLVETQLLQRIWQSPQIKMLLSNWLPKVVDRAATPYEVAQKLCDAAQTVVHEQ